MAKARVTVTYKSGRQEVFVGKNDRQMIEKIRAYKDFPTVTEVKIELL